MKEQYGEAALVLALGCGVKERKAGHSHFQQSAVECRNLVSRAQSNPAMLITEKYYNVNHTMLEENTEATSPNFSRYCPGSSISTPKKVYRPPPGTQFNPEPCFLVTPIRSVPPASHPSKGHCSGIKPVKNKKQKTSVLGSNQIPSEAASKPMQFKKRACGKNKRQSAPEAKREKTNANIQTDKPSFDLSQVPSPFCSCTGMPIACYKWGNNGWQSACCNCNISEYPLPINPKKHGARVPGRKMSNGAYAKLVVKLVANGHNLSEPINLKDHWARHGTNKFVTIK